MERHLFGRVHVTIFFITPHCPSLWRWNWMSFTPVDGVIGTRPFAPCGLFSYGIRSRRYFWSIWASRYEQQWFSKNVTEKNFQKRYEINSNIMHSFEMKTRRSGTRTTVFFPFRFWIDEKKKKTNNGTNGFTTVNLFWIPWVPLSYFLFAVKNIAEYFCIKIFLKVEQLSNYSGNGDSRFIALARKRKTSHEFQSSFKGNLCLSNNIQTPRVDLGAEEDPAVIIYDYRDNHTPSYCKFPGACPWMQAD